jgi:DNA glycosylase AlkZ-like
MLDRELYERRTLVRARCIAALCSSWHSICCRLPGRPPAQRCWTPPRRYLASQGLNVRSYERWAGRIEALLTGHALSATQVRSALDADREAPVPAVLNQMCDEGRLLRDRPVAGWRDARHTYRRFSEVLPHAQLDRWSPTEATAQLVKRYIARYGPVTLEDVAWWTGLGVGRCRTALTELEDEVMPVRVPSWAGNHVIVRADLDRMLHAPAPRRTRCHCSPALTRTRWPLVSVPAWLMQHVISSSTIAQAMRRAWCSSTAAWPASGTCLLIVVRHASSSSPPLRTR